jgi:hypothetical protein
VSTDIVAKIIIFLIIFGAMWSVLILMMFVIIFMGFGMIGVLVAIERAVVPEILLHISRITSNTTKTMRKKAPTQHFGYSAYRWLLVIPDVLDTKNLRIRKVKPIKRFPWPIFWKAMMWQLLLGTIVLIYISLNPLLLEDISYQILFDVATNVSTFIPLVIIPWFVFLRLDAKLKGPTRDFKIYSGIVYRMYRTFITLGTIIIIIRLAFKHVSILEIVITFPIYYLTFFFATFIFTFIYFNYFETDLAKDVAYRYSKIKD